jgi:hypothetical protein
MVDDLKGIRSWMERNSGGDKAQRPTINDFSKLFMASPDYKGPETLKPYFEDYSKSLSASGKRAQLRLDYKNLALRLKEIVKHVESKDPKLSCTSAVEIFLASPLYENPSCIGPYKKFDTLDTYTKTKKTIENVDGLNWGPYFEDSIQTMEETFKEMKQFQALETLYLRQYPNWKIVDPVNGQVDNFCFQQILGMYYSDAKLSVNEKKRLVGILLDTQSKLMLTEMILRFKHSRLLKTSEHLKMLEERAKVYLMIPGNLEVSKTTFVSFVDTKPKV